ncbi:MAG: hypothetical protein IPH34_07295 [Chitinophagaceae bacterium]|nr:hypothetical protein [Chitinophagaceae bacterium]
MIKKLAGETWKPLLFSGWRQLRNRYAVSNLGRIASYKKQPLRLKRSNRPLLIKIEKLLSKDLQKIMV